MRLTNRKTCCDLRSENPIETVDLLKASMRSYSPRGAAITIDDCREMVLTDQECEEFSAGVLRDETLKKSIKWAICKLLAQWMSGEIKDEAVANY